MNKNIQNILNQNIKDEKIIALDVGAKGGAFQLPKLANYTQYYGFEPNIEEAAKIGHLENSAYEPVALSNKSGERKLRITKHNSYSSFLEFDENNFRKHFHLMQDYPEWQERFKPDKTITVPTISLDQFMLEKAIGFIDFIKLDTQGTELEILMGGINALTNHRIGVIFCEVNFVQVYREQNLFSDLDLFLRKHHYEFIDCRFYPEDALPQFFSPTKNITDKPGFSVGGDAVFVPNLDKVTLNKTTCFKTGLVLASLGYLSIAFNFLERSGLSKNQILDLLRYFDTFQLKQTLRYFMPPIVLHWLKKLKNAVR